MDGSDWYIAKFDGDVALNGDYECAEWGNLAIFTLGINPPQGNIFRDKVHKYCG